MGRVFDWAGNRDAGGGHSILHRPQAYARAPRCLWRPCLAAGAGSRMREKARTGLGRDAVDTRTDLVAYGEGGGWSGRILALRKRSGPMPDRRAHCDEEMLTPACLDEGLVCLLHLPRGGGGATASRQRRNQGPVTSPSIKERQRRRREYAEPAADRMRLSATPLLAAATPRAALPTVADGMSSRDARR